MAAENHSSAPKRQHDRDSGTVDLDRPFFLIGTARSGSTLIRLILAHHPNIAKCEEFDYAVGFGADSDRFPPVRAYREWLENNWTFRATSRTIDPGLDYPELVRSFLGQMVVGERQTLVGAVVHLGYDRILRLWPRAKLIHLVRDPRNVARSRTRMGWEGNVWYGVNAWIEAETLWDELRPTLKPDQHCELRLEDLLDDPEREMRRVCAFLGVEYDPVMLEIDKDTTYARPGPGIASDWRDTLSPRNIRRLESRLGGMLAAREYAPSGLPPLRVTGPERLWLAVQHRLNRFAFRARRYGFWLSVGYSLCGRLPFGNWRRRIMRAYDEITIAHLK